MKKLLFAIVLGVACGLLAANYSSDTLTDVDQSDQGKVIVKYFSYATSTVAHTNDVIQLAELPMNTRVVGGVVTVSAMGGAQTFDMGIMGADGSGYYTGTTANDPDFFTASPISCSNAVADTFADVVAGDLNANVELGDRRTYLTISPPATVLWTTNETITGWIKYIEP